ncbi:hypothetical protein K443DRAFT_12933 [Laccaria amethystina LaAM-08-1]|uniref:Uncharacterized protein n=1 Tax=Laccaria amethystina LaAM-08-1 TaxID=1095629 RepID=A0A0C9WWZ9_9AGAR|nr:hypothetical protein K443DRAFT_12933 [Laccaria amethystina LaAM-08-1]
MSFRHPAVLPTALTQSDPSPNPQSLSLPVIKFDSVPVSWKGLPLEAALLRLTRFANSITRQSQQENFDISDIPSLPRIHREQSEHARRLPPPEEEEGFPAQRELSLTDALQPISRTGSPSFPLENFDHEGTPKNYDYSASLKSEPKASSFDKYRSVALRKTTARIRTLYLSRTTSSEAPSPGVSTLRSDKSTPWHRLNEDITGPLDHGHTSKSRDAGIRSTDITDIHISPPPRPEDKRTQEDADEHQQHIPQNSMEREPTFSSDGDPTPHALRNGADPGSYPAGSPIAFSSPAQSIAFTPTPAFPRPRARFDLPPPPADLLATPAPQEQNDHGDEEDLCRTFYSLGGLKAERGRHGLPRISEMRHEIRPVERFTHLGG